MNKTVYNLCVRFFLVLNRTVPCLCKDMANNIDRDVTELGVRSPLELGEQIVLYG